MENNLFLDCWADCYYKLQLNLSLQTFLPIPRSDTRTNEKLFARTLLCLPICSNTDSKILFEWKFPFFDSAFRFDYLFFSIMIYTSRWRVLSLLANYTNIEFFDMYYRINWIALVQSHLTVVCQLWHTSYSTFI